jgi:hypothetical protein
MKIKIAFEPNKIIGQSILFALGANMRINYPQYEVIYENYYIYVVGKNTATVDINGLHTDLSKIRDMVELYCCGFADGRDDRDSGY